MSVPKSRSSTDNIPAFVIEHLRRYVDSNGADGHLWDSTGYGDHGMIPTLLLTTTDELQRKTEREIPVIVLTPVPE